MSARHVKTEETGHLRRGALHFFVLAALAVTAQFHYAVAGGANSKALAASPHEASQKHAAGSPAAGEYAKGVVRAQPFDVKFVNYDDCRVVFKSAPQVNTTSVRDSLVVTRNDVFTGIGLVFSKPQNFQGEYYISANVLVSGDQTQPIPQLLRFTVIDQSASVWHNDAPYSMKLKFFKKVNGMLPGYIDLAVTDGREHTHVKGFFYATQKPVAL